MKKEDLYEFIRSHSLMVVSTIGKEFPESAVVEYASENGVLIFDTDSSSRKYRNILNNPKVSVVIGWDNDTEEETVQYEGMCTLLMN